MEEIYIIKEESMDFPDNFDMGTDSSTCMISKRHSLERSSVLS